MDDPKARFLEAEEQAHHLLDRLKSLEVEIQRHGIAAESLQEAREALVKLAEELGSAGSEMNSVIAKLQEIGTAEIIERINTSANALAKGILELTKNVDKASNNGAERMEILKTIIEVQGIKLEKRVLVALGLGVINLVTLALLVLVILLRA